MATIRSRAAWLTATSSFIATVAPIWWTAVLAAATTTVAALLLGASRWLSRADVQGSILLFLALFWTYVGVVFLVNRLRPVQTYPVKDFRYGLTFDALFPNFFPTHENALQLCINLRNYTQHVIKYNVEMLTFTIESRVSRCENGRPIFLTRGSCRTFTSYWLKLAHIKEFFDTKQVGSCQISILYGDIDGPPLRRLKMSFDLYLHFPSAPVSDTATNNFVLSPLGFTSDIIQESDEPV